MLHTGSVAPGQTVCFALYLERGEFGRIVVGAEVGYVRARLLAPDGRQLQVTWASSFATAAPSLPLAFEAPASGRYAIELSVPTWAANSAPQAFRLQMVEHHSPVMREARRRALRADPRVAWLRTYARAVRSIDPQDANFADLDFLREALKETRVVWLAEGDNGGGSDVLAKTRLVKFLHEHLDFDVLAFQAGLHSSRATWRALRNGDEPRAALLKSVFGALARSAEAEALMHYLSARARTSRPLEVTGFDSQFTGTAARSLLPELQAFLATHQVPGSLNTDDAIATQIISGTIAGQFHSGTSLPSAEDQSVAVRALRETAAEIERRVDGPEAARWAQIARSTAVQVDLALNNARGVSANAYLRGIVSQMGANLAWLATRGHADRKIIVWSHTLHAIREPAAIAATRASGASVRAAMSDIAGLDSFAIGLTSHVGRSHLVTGEDDYYQDLMPAQHPSLDFETLMDAANFQFGFVDLRSARRRGDWPGGRFAARPLYLIAEEAEWSAALDALLFIRTQEPRTRVK